MHKVYKVYGIIFTVLLASISIPQDVFAAHYTHAGSGYNLSAQDIHAGTYKGVRSMTYYTRTSYHGRIANKDKHYAFVRSKKIGNNFFGQSSNDMVYNGKSTSATVQRERQQDNTHFHRHER